MIERISKKYAMTEKGARDYVAAVFWSVLVNISKMLPVGVLATALSGIVEALTNGTDPRAGLTRFLVAGVLALAALFVTFLIQYKALYEATYRESANRRIRLAEVLRQLPLSFFGNRDLTDLTTTIMGDTETLEKAFSHFYPAMHGALLSTALISAGMLLYDWRMALALLWVVPASLLMVYLSRRMEKRHITKGLVTRRAATDAMQEVLECAPEIKACNQKARYIADLNRRLDEAEQDTIRGELFTGSVVTAAQSFLKLGIATTVLTGVTLMSRGDLALIPFLMFLIAATRVYDPIGSMFSNMAAVFACEVRIERMREIENETRMTGMTEYDPDVAAARARAKNFLSFMEISSVKIIFCNGVGRDCMGITLMCVLFDDASADKFDDADDEHKDEHGDVRDVGHVAVVAVADGEVAEAARAGDAGHGREV